MTRRRKCCRPRSTIERQDKAKYEQRELERQHKWEASAVIPNIKRNKPNTGESVQARDDNEKIDERKVGYGQGVRAPPDESRTEPTNARDCSVNADTDNKNYERHMRVGTLREGYCQQFGCKCCVQGPELRGAGWCSCKANTDGVCMGCWKGRYEALGEMAQGNKE